ncbi:MAG: hypothetical protein P8X81_02065 [Woeseiaceae bacterium]|jgi:hypothetical protein
MGKVMDTSLMAIRDQAQGTENREHPLRNAKGTTDEKGKQN